MPVPTASSFIGIARELTRGSPMTPVAYVPLTSFDSPNDLEHYVPDTGMRGAPVAAYDQLPTQAWAEPTYGGDVFDDTFGFWLLSALGDASDTGTSDSVYSQNLSADATAGSVTITLPTAPSVAQVLQIGTGATAEIRVVGSVTGSGPYVAHFDGPGIGRPLLFTHASGVNVHSVSAATAPYQHVFAALNSGDFQPPSLTVTDFNGIGAKAIPGLLVAELGLKFTATGLLTYTAKLTGFKSQAASTPVPAFTSERPTQAWTGATTLAGSLTSLMQDGDLTIRRTLEVIPTIGQQDPYRIWAGPVEVVGNMNLVFENTTEFDRYTAGGNTTLVINFATGASAAARALQLTMSKVLYTSAKPTRGKTYAELPIAYEAVANTTDVGGSSGYSPIKVLLKNTIPDY